MVAGLSGTEGKNEMDKIWVIEMFDGKEWGPTVGVGLCRADARIKKQDWEKRNPDDRFRIRQYLRNN